jgi:2-desacetyl-2-hydroxyethyl bacteriochlorophyllide A dehydrogenase
MGAKPWILASGAALGRGIRSLFLKAVCCTRPGLIEMVDRPPPVPAPGEVLIDVRFVGICGTDYHIFEGSHPYIAYPLVLGHELCGVVNATQNASRFRPGDPVVINPYLACGACLSCRAGKTNCCETLQVMGIHSDGGMCPQIAVPEQNIIATGGLSLRDAAMVEYLAIGAHAVRRTALEPGANVLVVGAGPIGLATAIFARIAGAEVTVMDIEPEKLAAARGMGIERTIRPQSAASGEPASNVSSEFAAVFDATGNIGAMNASIFYVRHGGSYTLVGVISGDLVFPDAHVHRRELTIRASRNATRVDFDLVIASIKAGKVPTSQLVTHQCTLDEVPVLLARWAGERAAVIKAIIEV